VRSEENRGRIRNLLVRSKRYHIRLPSHSHHTHLQFNNRDLAAELTDSRQPPSLHLYFYHPNLNAALAKPPATSGSVLSSQSKLELAEFIAGSVLPNTQLAYTKEWVEWSKPLREEANISDPYLQGVHEEEKASLVSLMMLRKYKQNRKGKAATAFTAAIRLEFAKKRLSSTFLDAAVVTTARASCRMNPAELRERRNSEPTHTVKLPISEDILQGMRARLWDGLSWCDDDKEKRMSYLCTALHQVSSTCLSV
jgi:hypothetical protein